MDSSLKCNGCWESLYWGSVVESFSWSIIEFVDDGGSVLFAENEVGFPIAGAFAFVDVGRPLLDTHAIGKESAFTFAVATAAACAAGLAQVPIQPAAIAFSS